MNGVAIFYPHNPMSKDVVQVNGDTFPHHANVGTFLADNTERELYIINPERLPPGHGVDTTQFNWRTGESYHDLGLAVIKQVHRKQPRAHIWVATLAPQEGRPTFPDAARTSLAAGADRFLQIRPTMQKDASGLDTIEDMYLCRTHLGEVLYSLLHNQDHEDILADFKLNR